MSPVPKYKVLPKKRMKIPKSIPRHKHIEKYEEAILSKYTLLRQLILEHGRSDLLCDYILDHYAEPAQWFHYDMMEFQDSVEEGIILAFAGARKTTYCTVAFAIKEILKNPNTRILFAAEAADQAKTFLRAVKSHFEANEEFREAFGDWCTGAQKWSDSEIIVNRRTSIGLKEPTIMCAGRDTSLIGRHFDIIICDDLVTEETASTDAQREKTKTYFYKTLIPRLEPGGRLYVVGTRWHDNDLYEFLVEHYFERNQVYVLGVLDEETDTSIWENKFPTERMHRLRKGSLSAFELQWMCRVGVGLGGIFEEGHFKIYDSLPEMHFKFQGVDLAAGQRERNDFFAHATIGVDRTDKDVYLIQIKERKFAFPRQVEFIKRQFDLFPDVVKVGVETNAYQLVMQQQLKEQFPDVPVVGIVTMKDKVARAQQLATIAKDKPFWVRKKHNRFVRRLCAFPNGPKDVFDAFDLAVRLGLGGARRRRRAEDPGLI